MQPKQIDLLDEPSDHSPTEAAQADQAGSSATPSDAVQPYVKVNLTIKSKETGPPWDRKAADLVIIHLQVCNEIPKRCRVSYSTHRQVALRIYTKHPSITGTVRFLLLHHAELFPDMSETSGEKNVRDWVKQGAAQKHLTVAEQQRASAKGRKATLPEEVTGLVKEALQAQVSCKASVSTVCQALRSFSSSKAFVYACCCCLSMPAFFIAAHSLTLWGMS